MAYTNAWNESIPTGAEAANTIDDIFRSGKVDLRERLGTIFGLSAGQFAADPILPNSLNLSGGAPAKIFSGTFINIRDSGDTQNLVSINGTTGETIVGYNTMASTASVKLNAAANNQKRIGFTSAGVDRWGFLSTNNETGSDAGTDFIIRAYNDAGTIIDNALTITRAAGGFITITRNLVMSTAISRIIPGATSLSFRNNSNSSDNLIITDGGAVTIRSGLVVNGGSGITLNGPGALTINITGSTDYPFIIPSAGASKSSALKLRGTTAGSANVDWFIGPNSLSTSDGTLEIGTFASGALFKVSPLGNSIILGSLVATGYSVTLGNFLITSTTNFNNGASGGAGTLTNAPTGGNPTKWVPINDNGVTRYIPTW